MLKLSCYTHDRSSPKIPNEPETTMSKLTKTIGTSGIALSLLAIAANSWACGDGTISIVGLPTLGVSTFQANAINASGRITGFSYLGGDTSAHAFFYDGIL